MPEGYKVHHPRTSKTWSLILALALLGGVLSYFFFSWFYNSPLPQATQTASETAMIENPTSTPLPSSTPTTSPTPSITPTPLAKTAVEFLYYYYSCINYARNLSELEGCRNSLSPALQAVGGRFYPTLSPSLNEYEGFYINYRYRYQLFNCDGTYYNVGMKYLLYNRPDKNFTTPIGGIEHPNYLRYQVNYSNGQWLIEHGYENFNANTC